MALSEDKTVWFSFIYEVVPEAIVPIEVSIFVLGTNGTKYFLLVRLVRVALRVLDHLGHAPLIQRQSRFRMTYPA